MTPTARLQMTACVHPLPIPLVWMLCVTGQWGLQGRVKKNQISGSPLGAAAWVVAERSLKFGTAAFQVEMS